MYLANNIMGVILGTFTVTILLTCVERKYNFLERIIGKKLKVIYYHDPFCIYKLYPVEGIFLAVSNGEYSCLPAGPLSVISDASVYTITSDEYDVEVQYGNECPVLNVLHRRYDPMIFNLIFKGKFLPKYKCVFHLPDSSVVHQGKITMSEPPIIVQPKPVPIFTRS